MRALLVSLATTIALASCSKAGPSEPVAPAAPVAFGEPTATPASDSDFAYLLTHLTVVAEAPLPHELPAGSNSAYRILGVTQQGNCVGGCPPSIIYVAAYNYIDHPDGHIRLCRVDGIRWFSQVRITSYKPEVKDGVFLVFDVRSNIEPDRYRLYQVSVAPEGCSIKFLRERRRGT